ncbi:MAG: hypothetical protein HY935_02305 [Nitrosomonadales bacterium]|nr:hypothetical protein [Nitrosomonadales bacterium]
MKLEEHQESGIRCTASSRHIAVMFASIVLGGCSVHATRIDVADHRTFLPALRAGVNLNEGKLAASELQTGHAIEAGIAKANGGNSQYLLSSQSPITLNNTTFTGPQQLRNDFDFYFADLSWRWRKFFLERSLGMETFAGIGYTSLGLKISSPSQHASERFANWGPQGGAGLIWRFSSNSCFQARIARFISPGHDGVSNIFRREAFYAKALDDNITLRAGYAAWIVEGQQNWYNNSDFQLRFEGPVLALDMNFNER